MDKNYTTTTLVYDKEGNVAGYSENTFTVHKNITEVFTYRYENEWMDWLKKTKSLATVKVFHALTNLLKVGSPLLYLSPFHRDRIQEDYGLSEQALCSALKELEKAFVIIRGSVVDPETGEIVRKLKRGQLLFNPSVAWKGKAAQRTKAIEEFFGCYELIKMKEGNGTKELSSQSF